MSFCRSLVIIISRFFNATTVLGCCCCGCISTGSILQAVTVEVVGGKGCCGSLGGPAVIVTIFGECSGDDATGLLENKWVG